VGYILAFFAALGFTMVAVFLRRGLAEENCGSIKVAQFIIISFSLLLFMIGACTASILGYRILDDFATLNTSSVLLIAVDGLLSPLAGTFLVAMAVSKIGAARYSALRGSNPLFVTILSVLLLGERINKYGFVGVLVLVLGISIVSSKSEEKALSFNSDTKISGSIYALLSGLAFALAHISRGAALERGATPNATFLISFLLACIVLLYFCRVESGNFKFFVSGKSLRYSSFFRHINRKSIALYLLAGLSNTIGAYSMVISFTFIPVWLAVVIRNIEPLMTLIISILFLKQIEIVDTRLAVGVLFVIIGVWLSVASRFL
jgi:drug/metabolite transporter (DMT)-like permease